MPDQQTRDANKAIARTILQAWNDRGESHLPDDLVSPRMVRYFPQLAASAARIDESPLDPVLPKEAFSDQHFTEHMLIADDRHVFIAWELTATHRGRWHGREATGRKVTVYGSDVIRVSGGKIIEHWDYHPKARIHAAAQLGLLDGDVQQDMIGSGQLGRNRRLR